MKKFVLLMTMAALIALVLAGCASVPAGNLLAGTTWVWVNKADGDKTYTAVYDETTVSVTIHNKDGSVYQEALNGAYTVYGKTIIEDFDGYITTSELTGRTMKDNADKKIVFTRQ